MPPENPEGVSMDLAPSLGLTVGSMVVHQWLTPHQNTLWLQLTAECSPGLRRAARVPGAVSSAQDRAPR